VPCGRGKAAGRGLCAPRPVSGFFVFEGVVTKYILCEIYKKGMYRDEIFLSKRK